ncbi:hypothetical protein [uncultured Methanoregula sp.]|uniref:hypothetical protein n=1 Tax=uncultured Methanoregula sp. TaxID=1005933 RepID=UPI002AAB28D8|nr:hypothetical protein [uncultured Methanoregula sp.]
MQGYLEDITADVNAGPGEMLVHGVAIKPGKPVITGRINKKPVIGLPGYPLPALTVLRDHTAISEKNYGLPVPEPAIMRAQTTTAITKETGRIRPGSITG